MPHHLLVDLLKRHMSSGWETLQAALDGLTEEEFWWKPSENAWTLKRIGDRWTLDYEWTSPHPKSPLTIAWLVVHIATCKVMYVEYAFGPALQTWETIPIPCDLKSSLTSLYESHLQLAKALDRMTDNDLPAPRKTNWGELMPTEQIFWTLIHHDIYHGAQIQTLRKLFQAQRQPGS